MGLLTDCDGARSDIYRRNPQNHCGCCDVRVKVATVDRGGQLRGVGRRGELRVNRDGVGSDNRI